MKTLKRLSFLFIAAMAFAVFANAAVASASPSGFQAGKYPAVLTGVQSGGPAPDNILYLGGLGFECTTPTLTSTTQAGPSSIFQVSGTSGEAYCFGESGKTPINYHGCAFMSLDPGPAPSYDGSVVLDCPEGQSIEIPKLWQNCNVTIDPDAGYLGNAGFENEGTSAVHVRGKVEGLTGVLSGSLFCTGKGSLNVNWYPHWKLTAKSGGVSTSLQLVSELPFGFFMAGKASEKESEQPRFEAESYSRNVSGGGLKFSAFGVTINCEESSLKDSISATTKLLTLDATYGKCKTVGLTTTVTMNGCYYTLTAQNAGPPYTGLWGIACSKEGSKIEYKAFNAEGGLYCTVKVGAQSGLSGVSLSNVGTGPNRGVALNAAVEGIAWERSGTCGAASGSTGTMTGTPTLMGVE